MQTEHKAISQPSTTGWLWDSKDMRCVKTSATTQYLWAGWKTLSLQSLEHLCKNLRTWISALTDCALHWGDNSYHVSLQSRRAWARHTWKQVGSLLWHPAAREIRVHQDLPVHRFSGYFSISTWMLCFPTLWVLSHLSWTHLYVSSIKRLSLNIWSRKVQWFFTLPSHHSIPLSANVFSFIYLTILLLYYLGDVSMHGHTCHRLHVEVRDKICRVSFPFPHLHGVWGPKWGHKRSTSTSCHLSSLINAFCSKAFWGKPCELRRK